MAFTAYQRALQDPRWQKRRLQILERDHWRCTQCGDTQTELQVHHRWYTPGAAPWESPDSALVTLCAPCHGKVRMDGALPMIVSRHAMSGDYGPIPTCTTADRFHYVAHTILVAQVARKAQKNPDSLWGMYLQTEGGHGFREQMHKDLSAAGHLNVHLLVQFSDQQGTAWTHRRLAVHFVSKYDPALEHTIFKHFEETAMAGTTPKPQALATVPQALASPSPQALSPSASLEMIIEQSQRTIAIVHELIRVRDTQEVHAREISATKQAVAEQGQALAQHDQALADLRARAGPAPGQMILREFVSTRLHQQVTDDQLKAWGMAISQALRGARPGYIQGKVWDQLARRHVNEYAVADLESFFRHLGLL